MKNSKTNSLAPAPSNVPNVQNGIYTVSSPGGHFTIRLHTALKGDLKGKRILSLLVGPSNEDDYKGVAFWDDRAKTVRVWSRFVDDKHASSCGTRIDASRWEPSRWSSTQLKLAIWLRLALGYGRPGYALLREGRCLVCNRRLTTPESIESGIGPVCAERAQG